MRCLSDDDCDSDTNCFVPSDERWSNNGSACSPLSTLGYSAKCGCCVHDNSFRSIQSLIVICTSTASDDDESHTIDVNATAIVLRSGTSTGAARGLVTISQLLRYDTDKDMLMMDVVPLHVFDKPLYVWRGVMVDTARHFVSHEDILSLIDGMYASKLNKLHIHATDSTAWTLRSDAYPELAGSGSWSRSAATFYSKSDITSIVERGRERFVDVIFELDTPAHTLSIARSHPEMMANCWEWLARSGYKVDVDSDDTISLNPLNMEARKMVKTVLQEIADLSISPYVHIGGDEVKYPCWNVSDEIREHVESVYGNSSNIAYARLYVRAHLKFLTQIATHASVHEHPDKLNGLQTCLLQQLFRKTAKNGERTAISIHIYISAHMWTARQRRGVLSNNERSGDRHHHHRVSNVSGHIIKESNTKTTNTLPCT